MLIKPNVVLSEAPSGDAAHVAVHPKIQKYNANKLLYFFQRHTRMHKEMVEPTDETKTRIELEARDKSRLETFIDGVFAIAITLLGFGFVVPLLQHSSGALLVFFVSLWPKFLGYFLAFFLLAAILNNNWRQFQNIALADWPLFYINVLFLAFIGTRSFCNDGMD